MSLWLPRTSPTLLTRIHSQQAHHVIRSQLISTLVLRNHPVALRVAGGAGSLRRLQSSEASSAPAKKDGPTVPAPLPDSKAAPPAPKELSKEKQGPLMTRAWKKVKHEAAHYWHGSKLLVSEVRISARLQWKILHGESLTRRERRQVCSSILMKTRREGHINCSE